MVKKINPLNIKIKEPVDILKDIYLGAILGESFTSEDLQRFKLFGLNAYKQKDELLFSLKVKVINAKLNLIQLKALKDISTTFAKNSIDFTNNQCIEFKNIKTCDIPEIFRRLNEVKLNSIFSDGAVVTNLLTCPFSGVYKEQIVDVSPIVEKLNSTFEEKKKYSNLPNKVEIKIDACMNFYGNNKNKDINFHALKSSNGKIQFNFTIGEDFNLACVSSSQIVPLTKAIINIYNDFGNREDEKLSKLSNLVEELSPNRFLQLLQSNLTFKIKEYVNIPLHKQTDRFGIFESIIENESFISFKLDKQIDINSFKTLIELLEKYKAQNIKITPSKNIVILDVATSKAKSLSEELEKSL